MNQLSIVIDIFSKGFSQILQQQQQQQFISVFPYEHMVLPKIYYSQNNVTNSEGECKIAISVIIN